MRTVVIDEKLIARQTARVVERSLPRPDDADITVERVCDIHGSEYMQVGVSWKRKDRKRRCLVYAKPTIVTRDEARKQMRRYRWMLGKKIEWTRRGLKFSGMYEELWFATSEKLNRNRYVKRWMILDSKGPHKHVFVWFVGCRESVELHVPYALYCSSGEQFHESYLRALADVCREGKQRCLAKNPWMQGGRLGGPDIS